jgi:hypothetical protein
MVIAAGQLALASDVILALNSAEASAATAQAAADAAAAQAQTAYNHTTAALDAANTAQTDATAAAAAVGGLQQQITNNVAANAAGRTTIDTHTAQLGALLNRIAVLQGTTPPVVPNAPTNPTSTAVTPTSVSVSATAPATGPTPTSYKWEYKRAIDTTFLISSVTTLSGTQSGLIASTSYNFRVSAVNAVGPSATSPVYTVSTAVATGTLTESAHGTTLTTMSGQIVDAALNVWTLVAPGPGRTDFQIAVNGVTQPGTGATLLKYYNPVGAAATGTTKHSTVHQNQNGDWYISTGVSGTNVASFSQLTGDPDAVIVVPPPVGVPAPAASVGYTNRTFGPNMSLGGNWFRWAGDVNATQNANGSITTTGGNNSWGQQVLTALPTGGSSFSGTAFTGGGYFEWTMSFSGPANASNISQGWPSLWIVDIEGPGFNNSGDHWQGQPSNYLRWTTINVAEWANDHTPMPASNTVYHEFSDFYGPPDSSGTQVDTGYHANGSPYTVPAGFSFSQPHKYGFLWVPATSSTQGYAQYYIDDVRVDTGVAVWNNYNPASPPPPVKGTTAFSFIDARHLVPIFGTGPQNPLTVSAFSVWQKGTTTPPPSGGTAPAPAAAVGFNRQVLGPNLILGTNWFRCDFYDNDGTPWNVTQSGTGLRCAGGDNNFNAHVCTTNRAGQGATFGGGRGAYFEATLRWENSYNQIDGWPAWWTNQIGMMRGDGEGIEIDFMEFWSNFNWGAAIHHWGPGSRHTIDSIPEGITEGGGFDHNALHRYGGLWVKATATTQGYVKWYIDDRLVFTTTYNQNGSEFSLTDTDNWALLLGTSDGNPMFVTACSVWQDGAAPPLTVPNSPSNATSTSVTTTSVSLSATAPTTGATPTSYKWEYKRAVDASYSVSSVTTLTGTQGGLIAGTSYNFRVSSVNSVGTSAPSGVYTVSTQTSVPVGNVPAPAAAVGFNRRVFGPDLILGTNWFKCDFYSPANGQDVTQSGNGLRLAGGTNNFNAHACSTDRSHRNNQATTFGGGRGAYFEATLRWENDYKGYPNFPGWPAFWTNQIGMMAGDDNNDNGIELDFVEFWTNFRWGPAIHHWGPGTRHVGTGAPADIIEPANFNHNSLHRWGGLWVRATSTTQGYIKFYIDDRLCADIRWNQSGSEFSEADNDRYALLLGTGPDNPMFVTACSVWQE